MRNLTNVLHLSDYAQQVSSSGLSVDQIIESLHDGVVVIDREGTIVYANSAYTRILGVPVDRVLGRNMREIQPDARGLKVIETGRPILRDSFYLKQLGLDVVISSTPIIENDRVIGAVTVFRTSDELLELYGAFRRAHGLVNYYKQRSEGSEFASGDSAGFAGVVGRGPAILESIKLASQVAPTQATVLITGENGVGKDVFAQAIHAASTRADKPFIAVNSGAIPDTLLESELFGFDSGAFTGAARGGKLGKFELAQGGTLFLDEVGDMSAAMQAKLLRVLQNKEVEKVGGTRVVKVDVRVIAATNANLEFMVAKGTFRQDLFYRLQVFPIHLPALRDRREDIPRLSQHFLDQCCNTYQKRLLFAPETIELLQQADWPGNVRQLRHVIERAVIVCDGSVLLPTDFQNVTSPACANDEAGGAPTSALRRSIRELEKRAYEEAIADAGGNKSKAMAQLGVSRRTFYKRLKEMGIQ